MRTLRRLMVVVIVGVATIGAAVTTSGSAAAPWDGPFDPDRLTGEIPEPMLGAYLDAATEWDIDWALLAAIGTLECDHGRHRAPGCWPPGTLNRAGARGPMQFLGSTWRHTADSHDPNVAGPAVDDGAGYATDGDGDGIADPWSAYDAVHAAARYLVDVDGRNDPHRAAKAYNAGPANPDPTAGEAYATAADQLATRYHQLAGAGPGTSDTTPAPIGGGCTVDDPTGTGGCVTPRAAHLLDQADRHHGPWPWPVACWSPHPWNPASDHPHGRACDWTVGTLGRHPTRADRAVGWQLADWLVANAGPLAIAYIVWDGHIWSRARPDDGWRPYHGGGIYDPADPTGGHYDHLHVSVRP